MNTLTKKAQIFKIGKSPVVVLPVDAWEKISDRVSVLEEYYQMSLSQKYRKDIANARLSKKEVSSGGLYKKLKLIQVLYVFKGKSANEFADLPRKIQVVIMNKLEFFMNSPNPLKFAEPLNNSDLGKYRFRVGDYRIIFDVENNVAKILKIGHRKDIYKQLLC